MEATRTTTLARLAELYDRNEFKTLNEVMTYGDYLDKMRKSPKLARNAFQYVYDMIMSKGVSTFERHRKTNTRYAFFSDEKIPIFGLEETLQQLVDFIHGAAGHYGTEKRVLLLHGPVGSSKSTICRLLKRGLEKYSRSTEGAWYTYKWINLPFEENDQPIYTSGECMAAMNENPLKLMPTDLRNVFLKELNEIHVEMTPEDDRTSAYKLICEGDLNPRCKLFMTELMNRYDGDWLRVVENHIRVIRKAHSEIDRVGIGTFQPKDEKNQDSTELTGDMNFAKIGHFGADSDPRAFNYDGEFEVGNRGVVEFIEMLKLANEFLYDLLGASQEHQIKPKKFSQIVVDELIIAHSVHGDTPIPHVYDGVLDVLPIQEMAVLDVKKLKVFSVDLDTGIVELTPVKNVFSHDYEGDWVENHQQDDVLTTTPNHSVYKAVEDGYETFYPGDDDATEIATVKLPLDVVLNYPKTDRWIAFFSENLVGV